MKNKKVIVIGLLCLALIFMGIGFALFSTNLNLSGTATASGTFDVKITNVELDSTKKTSGATNTTAAIPNNYAVTEQTLSATFSEPGDYITWNITVTNRGTIEAAITVDVNMLNDANGAYKLICDVEEGTTLAPGATTTFPCEMSFDKNHELTAQEFAQLPKGVDVTMTVSVTAVQKANYVAPPAPPKEYKTDGPWTIEVTENLGGTKYGTIVKYNFDHPSASTNISVPYSVDGVVVKRIDGITFRDANVVIYSSQGMKAIIRTLDDDYDEIKEAIIAEGITVCETDDCIQDGATIMGFYEFDTSSNSTSVAPVPSITSINFSQATALEEIGSSLLKNVSVSSLTFGNNSNIKTIESYAFNSCQLSGQLIIPASVESIERSAFGGSSSPVTNQITSVVFENNSHLKSIGDYAFEYNRLNGALTIPASVETIGKNSFRGMYNNTTNQITSISFSGSNLKLIDEFAFAGNNISNSITFPSSLEEIGNYAFWGGDEGGSNPIPSITFQGTSLTKIGVHAFCGNSLSGTLTLPAGLEEIGDYAFAGSSSNTTNHVSSVVFQGNNITTIGISAFQYNSISGTLTLPSSVETIGSTAFYNNSVEELHLGANINSIGAAAFDMLNQSLTDVYVDMTESEWDNKFSGSQVFLYTPTMHFN